MKEEDVDHGGGLTGELGPIIGVVVVQPMLVGMQIFEVLQSGELIDVVVVVDVSILEIRVPVVPITGAA